MTSPLAFLPLATAAVTIGGGVARDAVQGLLSAGGSFADCLAAGLKAGGTSVPVSDDGKSASTSSLTDLIDQLQQQLAGKLQSLGLTAHDPLTLQFRDSGEVNVQGADDSAALVEQLLQADAGLRQSVANLYQSLTSANPGASDFSLQLQAAPAVSLAR